MIQCSRVNKASAKDPLSSSLYPASQGVNYECQSPSTLEKFLCCASGLRPQTPCLLGSLRRTSLLRFPTVIQPSKLTWAQVYLFPSLVSSFPGTQCNVTFGYESYSLGEDWDIQADDCHTSVCRSGWRQTWIRRHWPGRSLEGLGRRFDWNELRKKEGTTTSYLSSFMFL